LFPVVGGWLFAGGLVVVAGGFVVFAGGFVVVAGGLVVFAGGLAVFTGGLGVTGVPAGGVTGGFTGVLGLAPVGVPGPNIAVPVPALPSAGTPRT
jgi:hypothetical protein